MAYEKWDIVSVNFGETTNRINDNQTFNKSELINVSGVNIRYEFSLFHMGVIITPSFLNEDNKVLVIPITSFKTKHNANNINHFILYKRYYHSLKHNSVLLLDEMRNIDISRITKKHEFNLRDSHKKVIKKKLYKIFLE